MLNKLDKNRKKPNQNDIDKLLAIPGVVEAVEMVRRYAFKGAREDVPQRPTPLGKHSYLSPFDFIINTKETTVVDNYTYEDAIVTSSKGILPNHIYLDVTYLPYDLLHMAYRSIVSLRKSLGVQKEDLREGAPKTFDVAKALKSAELANLGKPNKIIARELHFPVDTRDNPSGNYSSFRNYLKKGREIREKLSALEDFLSDDIVSLLEQL